MTCIFVQPNCPKSTAMLFSCRLTWGLALNFFGGAKQKSTRLQVVSLVLSFFLSICIACPALADLEETGPLTNFERFAPELYRGAQPSEAAFKELKKQGIKTVINLRLKKDDIEQERDWCEKYGMHFIHIPMGYTTPKLDVILAFIGVVTNKNLQPVYIHCRFGVDRTGAMVGLYRVIVQNWSYEDAYLEMRQHHFKPFLLSLKHAVENYANSKPADKERILANSRLNGQL